MLRGFVQPKRKIRMNGFGSALLPRFRRSASFVVCTILLACALPSHAATPDRLAFSKAPVPAALRDAIHRTLDADGWVEMQEIVETDPAFDPEFGYAVALHGTTAMIGAQQASINGNEAQGAVYVFEQIDGTWTETQKLVADDGQTFDTFGHSIVFNGTTALIGAYGAMVNDNFSQGAVYAFTLSNGSWVQTQKIVSTDGQAFDNFGYSLGLNGTTALIGADGATVGTQDFQGKAYVFSQAPDGTWTQGQTLTASDGGIGDIFGYSIAFDGTTAVIGAYGNNGYQGAAYVFGEADGTWSQNQKLVAADGTSNTYFGYATALSGSTLLIGAWGADPGGVDTQGAAYVFTEAGGIWTQTQELVAADGAEGDKFGHSVALQGTTALIGADGWTDSSAQGAVYAFDGSSGAFVETQTLVANDGQPSFQFGLPVTLDGNTALVGSWLWRSSDGTMPGAAYFFQFNGAPATYTIGGTVSGLVGSGLVLQQNGGDDLVIDADGSFTFATPVNDGASYSVTVRTQPGAPAQTCTVANGSGIVSGANVTDVAVSCTTDVTDRIFADGFDAGANPGGAATLSQTTETTPTAQNSAACGHSADGTTADNQYWRRYYFDEYAVTTAASVTSVDVSVEQTVGAPNVTVTLYTTPHSLTADTIDLGQLTQIGRASVAAPADAALTSVNVPITGTVADTVGSDLVVEVSTDDGSVDGTVFYVGSTPAAETHPSFISSTACGISDPTPTASIGYPDMHIIQSVNITD